MQLYFSFCVSSTFPHEKFKKMIPYCTQGCILEWQTMFPKGVFIFFCTKNSFSIFQVAEMEFFGEEPTKYLLQNWTK